MFKSSGKENTPFLKTNADGNLIFYPWAAPGEGYLVSRSQVRIVAISILLMGLLVCASAFGLIYASEVGALDENIIDYIAAFLGILFPALYLLGVFWLKKTAPAHLVPSYQRAKRSPVQGVFGLFLVLLQVWAIDAALHDQTLSSSVSIVIIVLCSAISAIILWLTVRLITRKGYLFTE